MHNGHDNDGTFAMKHEYSKLKLPETVYPGLLGGVIAPMATNGSTVFVPIVNFPITYSSQTAKREGPPPANGGELVALDMATGAVKWEHKFPSPAFGAATAVNDLVFMPTFNGSLYAFEANTGEVIWQTQLPANTNTGVVVDGSTLIAPAGLPATPSETAKLVAYRLP